MSLEDARKYRGVLGSGKRSGWTGDIISDLESPTLSPQDNYKTVRIALSDEVTEQYQNILRSSGHDDSEESVKLFIQKVLEQYAENLSEQDINKQLDSTEIIDK
jgi:hypothetical protein